MTEKEKLERGMEIGEVDIKALSPDRKKRLLGLGAGSGDMDEMDTGHLNADERGLS